MKLKYTFFMLSFLTSIAFAQSDSIGSPGDPVVVKHASCLADEVLPAEVAAFRVMEMSKVMNKERLGSLTVYAAAMDNTQPLPRIHKMIPSRFMVLTRSGMSEALIGATFIEKGSRLTDAQLLGSYAGALKNDFIIQEINTPNLRIAKALTAGISKTPVRGPDTHLLFVKLADGERLVVCGPKPVLNRLLF